MKRKETTRYTRISRTGIGRYVPRVLGRIDFRRERCRVNIHDIVKVGPSVERQCLRQWHTSVRLYRVQTSNANDYQGHSKRSAQSRERVTNRASAYHEICPWESSRALITPFRAVLSGCHNYPYNAAKLQLSRKKERKCFTYHT